MHENELATIAIREAVNLHKEIGPGLLEWVYEECYVHKLVKAGLLVERQKPIPLIYDGVRFECGFRCDVLIEKKLIIELKAIESIADIHIAKLLTYLRLTDLKLGLIMNFNSVKLIDGVRRVVNGLK